MGKYTVAGIRPALAAVPPDCPAQLIALMQARPTVVTGGRWKVQIHGKRRVGKDDFIRIDSYIMELLYELLWNYYNVLMYCQEEHDGIGP